ncbi:hypothetical protein HQO24_10540 [Rhodococcus fascians]|nr:hypothetical protein [Rhodococcus fascians]MBY4396882.1 hypothetical protein [Rhodococcus fascians]MBY4407361.1 hypothetical protein [Rhodococcus fascians]MBY4421510.1 hypothetical protein [Rhodococcus fascians]MBY4460737.1 hypothetical protein [Rhodococcus fascians]
MSIYRTKEDASPFKGVQTVAQVADTIGVSVAQVVAEMANRSRPGATASTAVDFTTAETILRVFQEEATT